MANLTCGEVFYKATEHSTPTLHIPVARNNVCLPVAIIFTCLQCAGAQTTRPHTKRRLKAQNLPVLSARHTIFRYLARGTVLRSVLSAFGTDPWRNGEFGQCGPPKQEANGPRWPPTAQGGIRAWAGPRLGWRDPQGVRKVRDQKKKSPHVPKKVHDRKKKHATAENSAKKYSKSTKKVPAARATGEIWHALSQNSRPGEIRVTLGVSRGPGRWSESRPGPPRSHEADDPRRYRPRSGHGWLEVATERDNGRTSGCPAIGSGFRDRLAPICPPLCAVAKAKRLRTIWRVLRSDHKCVGPLGQCPAATHSDTALGGDQRTLIKAMAPLSCYVRWDIAEVVGHGVLRPLRCLSAARPRSMRIGTLHKRDHEAIRCGDDLRALPSPCRDVCPTPTERTIIAPRVSGPFLDLAHVYKAPSASTPDVVVWYSHPCLEDEAIGGRPYVVKVIWQDALATSQGLSTAQTSLPNWRCNAPPT